MDARWEKRLAEMDARWERRLAGFRVEFRTELRDLRAELIKWTLGFVTAGTLTVLGVMVALLKL